MYIEMLRLYVVMVGSFWLAALWLGLGVVIEALTKEDHR